MEQFNFMASCHMFFSFQNSFWIREYLPHIEESQAHRYLDFTVNSVQLTRYSKKRHNSKTYTAQMHSQTSLHIFTA